MGISMDPHAAVLAINSWLISLASRIRESIFMVFMPTDSSLCSEANDFSRTATGFAIDKNVVVTVAHLRPSQNVCLVNTSGDRFGGRVLAVDKRWDLVFIESSRDLTPLRLSADIPPIGSLIITCGMPYGLLRPFLTLGIVSGYKVNTVIDEELVEGLMVLSTPTMPGMSGGPAVSVYGDVVGMVVANTMSGNEFALATPSRRIYYSYSILKKVGRIVRPRLGVRVIEGTSRDIEGVVISNIYNDEISRVCGVDVGDALISVNKRKIRSLEDLWDVLDESALGMSRSMEIRFYDYSEKNIKECVYPIEV